MGQCYWLSALCNSLEPITTSHKDVRFQDIPDTIVRDVEMWGSKRFGVDLVSYSIRPILLVIEEGC